MGKLTKLTKTMERTKSLCQETQYLLARNAQLQEKVAKGVMELTETARQIQEANRKRRLICQTSIKQLDSNDLSKLVERLLRDQIRKLSPAQLEESYQKSLTIRAKDPNVFHEDSLGKDFPINLRWVDLTKGTHSELESPRERSFHVQRSPGNADVRRSRSTATN